LEVWRDSLQIPANSAFLDGTLLLTVEALLGSNGPAVLTPVTLWELTVFIDALVSFDRLYCIANPIIDVSRLTGDWARTCSWPSLIQTMGCSAGSPRTRPPMGYLKWKA
jgi:hypothetical protein